MRVEWEAIVAQEKMSGNGFGSNNSDKKYHGKFDKSKIDCHMCGEFGHFTDKCDEVKKATRAVAQISIVDDEAILL
ncbi:hypothetical protein GUJ93_ZPchr0001g30310 [Zizania palustris]|uniref:CCHC-type domain-containing protein n=1 Tax=Zizania palustris TaxID=103762 RepID=A0A8J5RRT6_ZIZPA|nr:hypothetical protein GUJ93_ZPchr0001g30310 [Zizania palustris]